MSMTTDFLRASKIQDTSDHTVAQIMDFLSSPESIDAMLVMTKLGQPALAGVVHELEEKFAYSDFPLHHDAPDQNAPNRRNVGWMVKFIMGRMGYKPKKDIDASDTYLKKFAKSKYFSTSAVYEVDETLFMGIPDYVLELKLVRT